MSEESDKLAAGIWLSKMTRAGGLSNKTICRILEYAGGMLKSYELNSKTIKELIEGPPEKIGKTSLFLKDPLYKKQAEQEGQIHAKSGIRVISWTEALYPEKLKQIASSPAILYINGENSDEILKKKYGVSIVGTRTPTPYGEAVTQKIVSQLVERDIVIISGMARGIDSMAHQTALDKKGWTAAILGCGLDIVYPPENKELMDRIRRNGLLISECPPGTKPLKSYFPARNRIISGMADCVAVMEASKKSGTMITAGYADEQGKDLFAVPGSIFSPFSTGTNQLIQDGACVLTDAADMLWKIPFPSIQKLIDDELTGKNQSGNSQNRHQLTIRDILYQTEKTMDEIAEKLDISVLQASEMVTMMEVSGELLCRNGRFSLTDSYK